MTSHHKKSQDHGAPLDAETGIVSEKSDGGAEAAGSKCRMPIGMSNETENSRAIGGRLGRDGGAGGPRGLDKDAGSNG